MKKNSYKISVRSIDGSVTAIGGKATAVNKGSDWGENQELLHKAMAEAGELIELLLAHKDEVNNPDVTLASAVEIREKLGKKKIKLNPIRSALEQVGEAVAGVGVLADVVFRLQALISHLVS